MTKRILRMAASIYVAAIVLSTSILAVPAINANSAVLMDADTGRVIWQLHGEERSLIASTTKIMTALLVVESCGLQEMVSIPKEAVEVEGSSINLQEDEQLTVEALLYGMMLHSGNDAAVALAFHHSGSIEAFALKMNEKAEMLGLKNTSFRNPHGLDDDAHYSTALDLAKLTSYAMSNKMFKKIVSTKTAAFGHRSFTNHNKMLWNYQGAIGVKTGYTKAAGRILVSCAERGSRRLVCVTISDPTDWKDHRNMLDYGFETFENRKLLNAGAVEVAVSVIGGSKPYAVAGITEDVSCLVSDVEQVHFECHVPNFIFAPVVAGEVAGEIKILADGAVIARAPLFWHDSIMEKA